MADATVSVAIVGDASGLVSAIGQAESALSGLESSSRSSAGATNENIGVVDKFGKRVAKTGRSIKGFGDDIDQVTKPLQMISVATGAAGVASAKMAIEFEDNFASVKKTVDGTPEQLEEVKKGIIALTTTGINGRSAIPQTTADLTELAAAGGQLGIATENIVDFTEVMAQMDTATNLSGQEGAATLARFMNVTNTSQDQVRNLGSSIVDLGNNFATTEAEIAALSLRMGETGGVVGISAQDILGYATALSSMGIEAEAGGSAVSRIWMTMQKAVAAGGDDLKAFAEVSGKSADEFKKQWETDSSGAFQSFIKGLSKAEDQITKLDELGFGNIRDIAALQALASTKGIDLMTEALERSNKAWSENTALQREADAKADTTAGKMAIAKNNVVEAARSMGEVMLPTIVDVTSGIAKYSQGLAKMSDGQKKAVVTGAAVVVGMGAVAKGTAGAIKTVGNITEGVGKLIEKAPKISKIGSAIATGITSPAGLAALAIAGIGTAGVIAYKEWEKHQYHWADDMDNSSKKLLESAERYKTLSDYSVELKELEKVVKNPKTNTKDLEKAKERIKEIADLLDKEYDLKINVDDEGLDKAVDKVEDAVKALKDGERLQAHKDYANYFEDMLKVSDKFREAQKGMAEAQKKFDKFSARDNVVSSLWTDMQLEDAKYSHSKNLDSYIANIKDLAQKAIDNGLKDALTIDNLWDGNVSSIDDIQSIKGFEDALKTLAINTHAAFAQAEKDLTAAKENTKEYEEAASRAGEALSKMLASDTALGNSDGISEDISRFKELGDQLKADGANTDSLAKSFATAKQGFTDFGQALEKGSVSQAARDFIDYKKSIDDFKGSETSVIATAAAMKNGFTDIETASHAGKEAINGIIADMRKLGQENGMFEGLDTSGIADKLTEMARSMDLIPDNKEVRFNVDTGGFEVVDEAIQSLTKLEGKSINIPVTVDGQTDKLELTAEQVQELQNKGVVSIKVDAEGNVELLNEAGEAIAKIPKEPVTAKVNVDTNVEEAGSWFDKIKSVLGGTTAHAADLEVPVNVTAQPASVNADAIMAAVEQATAGSGEATVSTDVTVNYIPGEMPMPEIAPVTAEVNYTANYSGVEEAPDKEATAKYKGDYSGVGDAPGKTGTAKYKGDFSGVGSAPTLHGTVVYDAKYTKQATGTNFHPGGLAMVNDQKGVSDPRELIVDKGRAFIPEGKNVILPLSRGAKVYTAAQTKAIMNGMGIPHYARGTENSDAFTNAQNDYAHYIKTHAVSTEEQLEKWNKILKEIAKNDKDIQDAEEEIYSLRQKLYSEQLDDIDDFLKHQKTYRNLDYDQTVALIREQEAVVQKAYDDGLITKREYLRKERELDEQYLDEYKDMMSKLRNESQSYISARTALNDWDIYGDDAISAYNRLKDRESDLLSQGLESWDDYYSNLNTISENMLDGRIAQSENWLEHQRKYNSMNTADYIAGIDRMLDYTYELYDKLEISAEKYNEVYSRLIDERADAQRMLYDDYQKRAETYYKIRDTYDDWDKVGDSKVRYWTGYLANIEQMYRDGNIGWQEYMDESMDKYLELYKAYGDEYDDKLQKLKDDMSDISTEYADRREALQKSWAQTDRDDDLSEVNRLLDIYKNSSTEAGKQKYKDLLDQKKQLERDQEIADLEAEEAAKLDEIQKSYDALEADKKRTLDYLRRDTGNVFAKVKDMKIDTSNILQLGAATASSLIGSVGTIAGSMNDFTNAINRIADKLGTQKVSQNVYNNNGNYTINSGESARDLIKQFTGTVVSGLGSVIIRGV